MSNTLAKYKLKEERGATILMALLALLVVAMVSTVILSAATSTVRQNKADQELQQNLLDLQSAGEFTRETVEGNFVVTVTATSTDNSTWDFQSIFGVSDKPYEKALIKAVKEVYWPDAATSVTTSTPRTFTIDATYPAASNFEGTARSVKSSFVLKRNAANSSQFDLVFTFNSASNEAKTNINGAGQVLYLTLNGSESQGASKVISSDKNNNPKEWERTFTYRCTKTSSFTTSNPSDGGQ